MATLDIDKQKKYKNPRLVKWRKRLAKLKYILLSSIPGTSPFKFFFAKKTMKSVNKKIYILNDLTSVSKECKLKNAKKFKRCEFNLLYFDFLSSIIPPVSGLFFIFIGAIFSYFLAILVVFKYGITITNDIIISYIFYGFILFGFSLTVLFILEFIIKKFGYSNTNKVDLIWMFFNLFIGIFFIYEFVLIQISNVEPTIIFISYFIYSLVIYPYPILVWRIINNIKLSRYPIEFIIDNLLQIISSAEAHNNSWINLEGKQKQLLMLEEVSKCIEHYLVHPHIWGMLSL